MAHTGIRWNHLQQVADKGASRLLAMGRTLLDSLPLSGHTSKRPGASAPPEVRNSESSAFFDFLYPTWVRVREGFKPRRKRVALASALRDALRKVFAILLRRVVAFVVTRAFAQGLAAILIPILAGLGAAAVRGARAEVPPDQVLAGQIAGLRYVLAGQARTAGASQAGSAHGELIYLARGDRRAEATRFWKEITAGLQWSEAEALRSVRYIEEFGQTRLILARHSDVWQRRLDPCVWERSGYVEPRSPLIRVGARQPRCINSKRG